jgi:hypothetical protein
MMLSVDAANALRAEVSALVSRERLALARLREHCVNLRASMQRIHPRSSTAISLVGTDGGNNQLRFDPFLVQLIRVVDSSENEYCLQAVSPNSPLDALNDRHIDRETGNPLSLLGRMMVYLGVTRLQQLSPVFAKSDAERSSSWVLEYRGFMEWAVLFHLVREKDFGTDVLIVRDGPLREKMFSQGLFRKYREGLEEGIAAQAKKKRRIFLVGVIKHSNVLQKYRLALSLEGVLKTTYPCFARVPAEMLAESFRWKEWQENVSAGEEFVGGVMHFVKFGGGPYDPVWLVDVFSAQADEAQRIFGYLLHDSINGFPIPYYPQCLQRAHEAAALVDFDFDILEHEIAEALKEALGKKSFIVDELGIQESDLSQRRY